MDTRTLAAALALIQGNVDRLPEVAKGQLAVLRTLFTEFSEDDGKKTVHLPNKSIVGDRASIAILDDPDDYPPELHKGTFDQLDGLVMDASMSGRYED